MAYESEAKLIREGSLRNEVVNGQAVGFSFDVKLYTYRGSYLSCIEKLDLLLDGESIAPENIVFLLNGKRFLIHQLPELYSEYWFLLDDAHIIVHKPGGLGKKCHSLTLSMDIRIPYTGYFGTYHNESAEQTVNMSVAV